MQKARLANPLSFFDQLRLHDRDLSSRSAEADELHKAWGGIVAGAFFVIPSIFVLWGLSFVYAAYGNIPWIAAVFYGLKPAVMAIVAAAVIRIGRKALKNSVMWSLAALAFIAIFFFKVRVSDHHPCHRTDWLRRWQAVAN